MVRELHASIDNKELRELKFAAIEGDTNISSILRALVRLFLSDKTLRKRVLAAAEPDRRGRPRKEAG
jgi:hypothetical protein